MARFVTVGGQTTGVPGVRQESIQPEGGGQPGFLESGVVALLGECEGTIQPGVVHEYRTSRNLKTQLRKGRLYDASRFAFKPSRNDPLEVSGAQKLLNIRVNPATQGTNTLQNGSSADLITLTSRAYGLIAGNISRTVAAGTSGGPGKKLTISEYGKNDEVGDDLGFQPVFLMRYTGDGSTATMTISSTTLATTLAGDQTDGSANLSISFSTYDTIEKLVNYINAQTGYEAVAYVANPASYLCSNLDYVSSAVDIKQESVTGAITIAISATTFSGTFSGLDDGDVMLIGSEYMWVTDATAKTVVRGYMDSTPAAHTSANASTYYPVLGVNQAMIEWVNARSQRLTAARASTSNVGQPANSAQTYLTGAGEGSTGNSDWQAALNALREYRVNFIVVLTDDATVHGYLQTHLDWRWGVGGSEAIGHVGAAKDETLAQLKLRAKARNSKNLCLHFQDINRDDDEGTDTNYDPWAMAVLAAAIQAGTPFGEPLTHKTLDVSAIGQRNVSTSDKIDLIDDADTLIEYGICHARYYDNEYRIVRALTTWTNDDTDHHIECNVRHSLAWTVYKVRDRLRFFHFGRRARKGNANAIKGTLQTTLDEIRDVDEAIVGGQQRVNGNLEPIPAHSDHIVDQVGNVAQVAYRCVPIGGTDFVNVSTTVGQFQDAA